jgi:hypothetical protein
MQKIGRECRDKDPKSPREEFLLTFQFCYVLVTFYFLPIDLSQRFLGIFTIFHFLSYLSQLEWLFVPYN